MSRAWLGRIVAFVFAGFAVVLGFVASAPVVLVLLPFAALLGLALGRRYVVPQAMREAPSTARLGGARRAASVAWLAPVVVVLGMFVLPRLGVGDAVLLGSIAILIALCAGALLAVAQSSVPALLDRLSGRS